MFDRTKEAAKSILNNFTDTVQETNERRIEDLENRINDQDQELIELKSLIGSLQRIIMSDFLRIQNDE